ncbi:ABC transporter permease [Vibrio rotiferianus]|uniref:ABC transporter permease n=1 Tax=Vibrio rotiferianus TaxID=190895 RepID=UPI00406A6494
MSVTSSILKLIIRLFILITLTSSIIIALISYSPINPVNEFLNGNLFSVSLTQKQIIGQYLGTDLLPVERFLNAIATFLSGSFGFSSYYQQPVVDVLKERVGYSLWLLSISWILTFIIGYLLGLISGVKPNSILGKSIKQVAWILSCMPTFWIGILLIAIFALHLNIFPVGGSVSLYSSTNEVYDKIIHSVLPISTIVLAGIGPLILHTREKVIEITSSEYVKYAKAHGVSSRNIIKVYIIKGSILPTIVIHFAAISELLGYSAMIELIFNYPGLGSAFINSGLYKDSSLLLALSIFSICTIALSNLLADYICKYCKPNSFRT